MAGEAATDRLLGVPEGDTIYRAAARLRPALVGHEVLELRVHRTLATRLPAAGTTVTSVEAHGKHLVITFDSGHVLDSHLLMNGSWDLVAAGRRLPGHPGELRALIRTAEHQAVLRATPVARLLLPGDPERPWERLGPDLCHTDVDLDAAVERAGWLPPDTEIGQVLLDQRPACGIGNVYKSEVLWAEQVHPRTPLGALGDDERRRLYARANRLLRANLTRSRRVTHGRGLAVYGRERRSCPRCAGRITVEGLGPQRRPTYWCARCQRRRPLPPVAEGSGARGVPPAGFDDLGAAADLDAAASLDAAADLADLDAAADLDALEER